MSRTAQRAVALAALVLVAGPVALSAFWVVGEYANLPGLPTYLSATWGDGLLLPAQAFSLFLLADRLQPSSPRIVATVAGVGLLTGVSVIAAWLLDPSPVLNWTQPRAHHFDVAGWWHAVYLVAACGLFAWLWARLLLRLRSTGLAGGATGPVSDSAWFGVALAGALGYAALLAHDSKSASSTIAGITSFVALLIAAVCLFALLVVALRERWREVQTTLLGGAAIALGLVTLIVLTPGDALAWVATAAAALAGLAQAATGDGLPSAPRQAWDFGLLRLETLAVTLTYAAVPALGATAASNHRATFSVIVIVGALLIAIALRAFSQGRPGLGGSFPGAIVISACLLTCCLVAAWLGHDGDSHGQATGAFVLTLIGALLGGVFLPHHRADFDRVMNMEAFRPPGAQPTPEENILTVRIWARVGGYAGAAFAALLALTIAVAPGFTWAEGTTLGWDRPLLLLCVSAAVSLISLPQLRGLMPTAAIHRTDRLPLVLLVPTVGAAAVLLILGIPAAPSISHGLALVQSLILAGFCLQSMLGNGALLHAVRPRGVAWVTLLLCAFAIGDLVYWATTAGLRSEREPIDARGSLLSLISAAICMWVINVNGVAAIFGCNRAQRRTQYGAVAGASQDGFLAAILWLIVVWMPHFTVAHIEEGADRWAAIGSVVAGFLLLFCPAFLWVLENNDTHNGRELKKYGVVVPDWARPNVDTFHRLVELPGRVLGVRRKVPASEPPETTAVLALGVHTAVQNTLALTLVAVTGIGAIALASGATVNPPATPTIGPH